MELCVCLLVVLFMKELINFIDVFGDWGEDVYSWFGEWYIDRLIVGSE